ncbi:hypothetical protein [Paenibacillus arenilitoris]|uniref:Flagellar protein FliT n=1 Tax=Paenibacillus arenilitoris TaxID=2772299 RepID=A0A927CJ20_9BACL|nr:hypothetical protein [Paenibacillus arenilitoris]MBD2868419.1 hypothetical protein [Paenibacillus arenilitoris]
METLLQRLNQLSSELVSNLRGSVLEEIDAYMEERDRIFAELERLGPPSSSQVAEHRQQVERLFAMDRIIIGRMTELRDEANREIDKLNKGKRSKMLYESSYGDDSLFFDRKR